MLESVLEKIQAQDESCTSFNIKADLRDIFFKITTHLQSFVFIHDNKYYLGISRSPLLKKEIPSFLANNPQHFACLSYEFNGDGDIYIPTIGMYSEDLINWQVSLCDLTSEKKFICESISLQSNELDRLQVLSKTEKRSKKSWLNMADSLIDKLNDPTDSLSKCVLARRIDYKFNQKIDSNELLKRCTHIHKQESFFFKNSQKDNTFLGASPECLLKYTDGEISVDAIAGTLVKPEVNIEDACQKLIDSDKDQKEHQAVIDQITSILKEVSTVSIGEQYVLRLKKLLHLKTPITAKFYDSRDKATKLSFVINLIDSLHPTPAVGGTPKKEACDYINKYENLDRGPYAAPIGIISDKRSVIAVGIRSALINENKMSLFAGAGIVKDSQAVHEYEEIDNKLNSYLPEEIFDQTAQELR